MATLLEHITENIANIRVSGRSTSSIPPMTKRRLDLRIASGWPDEGEIAWCLREDGAISASGHINNLSELPDNVFDTPVHVWSPASATLLTETQLPTRSRGKIIKALPFALEDQLLDDPKKLFFSHQAKDTDNLSVAITTKMQLKNWISTLDAVNLTPVSLTPETLAVPSEPQNWMLFHDRQSTWVRTGTDSGFACPEDLSEPPYILISALNHARELGAEPGTLVVNNPPKELNPEHWSKTLGLDVSIQTDTFWNLSNTQAVHFNLLQDEFSPRVKSNSLFHKFRAAGIIFLIWILGTLTFTTYEWWQLSREHNQLNREMTAIFKASFPKEAALIVNPYKQMRANIEKGLDAGDGHSGSQFLSQLGKLSPVFNAHPKISLKRAEYRNEKLLLRIELPDYVTLEALKNSFLQNHIKFQLAKATQQSGKVIARITLEGAGL